MKKAISMMLATAMAATCLAGCGSAASSSAAASSEAASSEATSAATSEASTGEKTFENTELNIAVFEGGYGSDYWDEITKRFEAAYPGVTVNMQISPKIGDIIRPQIVAGNVPDFISMNDNDSTGMISSMSFRKEVMEASAKNGFTNATDAADYLVNKGVPFRDAHGIVGQLVLACIAKGIALDDLSLEEYKAISPVFEEDVYEAISMKTCVEKRLTIGAPGQEAMKKVIGIYKKQLDMDDVR